MIRFLYLAILIAVVSGCWYAPVTKTNLTVVVDEGPVFSIQADSRFVLEFGRGSGSHGLDTVSIDDIGTVVTHRRTNTGLEKSSFSITATEIAAILNSLKLNGIMTLDREYHHEGIADGIQWVFRAEQGDNKKSIYFNNHFPDKIILFASDLDSILDIDNRKIEWESANLDEVSGSLWGSIKTDGT